MVGQVEEGLDRSGYQCGALLRRVKVGEAINRAAASGMYTVRTDCNVY